MTFNGGQAFESTHAIRKLQEGWQHMEDGQGTLLQTAALGTMQVFKMVQ